MDFGKYKLSTANADNAFTKLSDVWNQNIDIISS